LGGRGLGIGDGVVAVIHLSAFQVIPKVQGEAVVIVLEDEVRV
jgi:hypothetical protein